jgi:hypothetical protein
MNWLHLVMTAAKLLLGMAGVPASQQDDFMACYYVPDGVAARERAACVVELQHDAVSQEFALVWADAAGKVSVDSIAPAWEE